MTEWILKCSSFLSCRRKLSPPTSSSSALLYVCWFQFVCFLFLFLLVFFWFHWSFYVKKMLKTRIRNKFGTTYLTILQSFLINYRFLYCRAFNLFMNRRRLTPPVINNSNLPILKLNSSYRCHPCLRFLLRTHHTQNVLNIRGATSYKSRRYSR